MATFSFLLMAAGKGSRMGGVPKQFRFLAGVPVWLWSVRIAELLYHKKMISELIIVTSSDVTPEMPQSVRVPFCFVEGGDLRAESVRNGLTRCSGDFVLIHDAARPFLEETLCLELMDAAQKTGAALPVLPSVDSLKRITEKSNMQNVSRDEIFRAQTPQLFCVKELQEAMEKYGLSATDEAECWIAAGKKIAPVSGSPRNFKITTDFDWDIAKALVQSPVAIRVGHGFDVHPLCPGRPLILGGVNVESDLGLDGHSDADIICHTIADALLGAAGEPDIGTLFPASDEQYKNADSTKLLTESIKRIALRGMQIVWIDVTLQAQVPRLGGILPLIKQELAAIFRRAGVAPNLNLKVKSGEYVGSVGRGECIVCHAVATLSGSQEMGFPCISG